MWSGCPTEERPLSFEQWGRAHLIADFRQLVGFTPGAFVKRAADRGNRFASKDVAVA